MLHRLLSEPENGGDSPAFVGDHDAVDVPVVPEAGSDRCLPVNGVVSGRLNPCEVRVFEVYEEAALLAEVSVEDVPYHLRRAFVSLHHRRPVRRHLEDETVVFSDAFLAQALGFGEEAGRALWIQTLQNLFTR